MSLDVTAVSARERNGRTVLAIKTQGKRPPQKGDERKNKNKTPGVGLPPV